MAAAHINQEMKPGLEAVLEDTPADAVQHWNRKAQTILLTGALWTRKELHGLISLIPAEVFRAWELQGLRHTIESYVKTPRKHMFQYFIRKLAEMCAQTEKYRQCAFRQHPAADADEEGEEGAALAVLEEQRRRRAVRVQREIRRARNECGQRPGQRDGPRTKMAQMGCSSGVSDCDCSAGSKAASRTAVLEGDPLAAAWSAIEPIAPGCRSGRAGVASAQSSRFSGDAAAPPDPAVHGSPLAGLA